MNEPMRRKQTMKNFDFCYGAGVNFYEMETGYMYMIQEYREKMDRGEKPDRIDIQDGKGNVIGSIGEYALRERMKDPEPDPRYAPETLEEHRRNF